MQKVMTDPYDMQYANLCFSITLLFYCNNPQLVIKYLRRISYLKSVISHYTNAIGIRMFFNYFT